MRDVFEYPTHLSPVKQFCTSRCHAQFNSSISISIIQYLFYQFIHQYDTAKNEQIQRQQQQQHKKMAYGFCWHIRHHMVPFSSSTLIHLFHCFPMFPSWTAHFYMFITLSRRHLRLIRAASPFTPRAMTRQ